MHDLETLLKETIAGGLKRRSLTTCSRWTKACRVMGKPFPGPASFDHHPWSEDMHDSNAMMNVGQKAAQMGFTETALDRTFFKIDVERVDSLYVLPAKTPDASDFSAARFDPALELSPRLSSLFSDVKNVGHKRAGTTNLYIRGSKSRGGLKSIPVGFIVFDEVDEMDQDNIPLAFERTSGQPESQKWMISTPTVPNFGINKWFVPSSQNHYVFKCPSCSQHIELEFPSCLVITGEHLTDPALANSHLICPKCKTKLNHEDKINFLKGKRSGGTGFWQPMGPGGLDYQGWLINQLYSMTVTPQQLAEAFMKSLKDRASEQEFYNSKLGLPHIVEGARVSDILIDLAIEKGGGYVMQEIALNQNQFVTMGVDVGSFLHYEICAWNLAGRMSSDLNVLANKRVLKVGKCQAFEELDTLMRNHQILMCVIDANPERRKAYEFACRFPGYVKLCFYGRGVTGKQIKIDKEGDENVEDHKITVDRTSWLDMSLGRFHSKTITLPRDIPHEYREHIKSPVRHYEKDNDGNQIGKYINTGDDHYAHAGNYSEIALPLAASMASNKDVKAFL